ncbi:restriction endonuclease subunit S [Corynebacterium sp. 13CS0277]|uniref:restriction endonuclease subunit S n=1 Tax=Corynebacterium sp. 13CS0277 TaxID=2071994 RepID=UPI000D04002A|nr:restriction endonuclease subunit S [Corynebacterium sp. 13CS0277]PRQ11647.1 restriction endonuclease subunit S [Corynebacterium sp. 13CS0277]
MKAQATPEIRFLKCVQRWQKKELGQLLEVSGSGGTPSATNPDYYGGPIPFLGIADINDRAIVRTVKSLTKLGLNNSTAWLVPAGAISLAMYASVGKVGILQQDTATSQAFYNMVFRSDATRDFVYARLLKSQITGEWEPYISTGTQRNLNAEKVKAFPISLPELPEQEAIGSFFKRLDEALEAGAQKVEKLRKFKQAMLLKMFPQGNSRVPEIRFAGFEEPWERRKLGEFYEFKNGLNKGKEFFGHGIPIVNFTDVFHNRAIGLSDLVGRVNASPEEIKALQVKKGDIFFTRTSETLEEIGMPSVMLEDCESTVFSGFVLRGRASGHDPLCDVFKAYVFYAETFRFEMRRKSSMTTRALTSGAALRKMYFSFPSSFEEQEAIGAFFRELDELLEVEEQKLEKLRQLKAAFLQKMFV